MGRKVKERLDYFPMDVDMFRDPKIMRLIRKEGAEAMAVYSLLLCHIYEQGYWIGADEDLMFLVASDICLDEEKVASVVLTCAGLGLFDSDLYIHENVLTSHGIQERYLEIKGKCKNKASITEYSLISSEEMTENEQKEEFIPNKYTENDISSEEMTENEQKEGFPLKNKDNSSLKFHIFTQRLRPQTSRFP